MIGLDRGAILHVMEVEFIPEQQRAIEQLAAQNGSSPAEQVRRFVEDALERQQSYDRWFRKQVREGMAAAERGELVDHEAVRRMLDERIPGNAGPLDRTSGNRSKVDL